MGLYHKYSRRVYSQIPGFIYPMSDFFRFSIQFARLELFARCVNALGRAYPISTLNVAGVNLTEIDCVNALSRAYPISTVPFQKPFKISGFRSHFQGVIVRKF